MVAFHVGYSCRATASYDCKLLITFTYATREIAVSSAVSIALHIRRPTTIDTTKNEQYQNYNTWKFVTLDNPMDNEFPARTYVHGRVMA